MSQFPKMEAFEYEVRFTNRSMTSMGGLVLFKKFLDKLQFRKELKSWGLPIQQSGRGYDPVQLIEQFLVSIWAGANRFAHCDSIRFDSVINKVFGWEKAAEHKAIQRILKKVDSINEANRLADNIYKWVLHSIKYQGLTLDFDSTVITRYGDQEGSALGYNPKAHGRHSHHPLIAFISSVNIVSNFWLRSGNSGADNNFTNFLTDTLSKFNQGKVSAIRADSGFWSKENIDFIKGKGLSYAISVRLTESVKKSIIESDSPWKIITPGIEIKSFSYTSKTWTDPQRMIAVRRHKSLGNKAIGKQLNLFEEEDFNEDWRYSVITSNIPIEDVDVWDFYRKRANCENQIKELKYDFGLDKFAMKSFWPTETAINFCILAYNLMTMFRLIVMRVRNAPTRSTVERKYLLSPGLWSETSDDNGKPILWLSVKHRLRPSFVSMWQTMSY